MLALDAIGVGQLLDASRGTELESPIVVAIGTGLRRGELLGLRWSDVDFPAARLSVQRMVETVNGVIRTKQPKTARSARTIALPQFVLDALRKRKLEQAKSRLFLGLGHDADAWVFTRADEQQWEPGSFSSHFARLVKANKLPHIRFHDLRHTFGTLALAAGIDLKQVSTALGHSTISMTANTYIHAVEALHRDAAVRIDGLLGATVSGAIARAVDTASARTVPQRCHISPASKEKARRSGPNVVAPTRIELVSSP